MEPQERSIAPGEGLEQIHGGSRNDLLVFVTPRILPGDYDDDGRVDARDFVAGYDGH